MTKGACASGDSHSAQAGVDILAAGGNAIDAAVGAALAACVTLPTMTGLGGAGLMTILIDGRVTMCDFFGAVPGLNLKKRGERELDLVTVDFEGIKVDFRVRAPSIAVPGTVAGLWEIHLRHGRLPLPEVAAPAIALARRGYETSVSHHKAYGLLAEIFRMTPEAWALVSKGTHVVRPGEVMRNPRLADTLDLLVADGPAAFYEGGVAHAIVEAAEAWLTREDLAAYRPIFREPLEGSYRGWSLHMPAMPSVTGGILLSALRALDVGGPLRYPLDPAGYGRIARAMRAGEAVRTAEYETRLFEEGYLQGLLAASPGGNTMQVSTADEHGNLVSYTTTVGESAGIVAPGTGMVLNNFLGEEDILPAGGLRAAGRRMMTSMCPVILHDGVDAHLALGSAGSSRIKSAILQVILNLVDGRQDPREATLSPRIHVENDTLYVEGYGRTQAEVEALRPSEGGFDATWDCGFYFGGVQVVERTARGFRAGADEERRGCAAMVV